MKCRCGHDSRGHKQFGQRPCDVVVNPDGSVCDDPFTVPFSEWRYCPCPGFDDTILPAEGERLTFGVHRQSTVNAETAEAWPSMASWSARVKARTTRALRSVR